MYSYACALSIFHLFFFTTNCCSIRFAPWSLFVEVPEMMTLQRLDYYTAVGDGARFSEFGTLCLCAAWTTAIRGRRSRRNTLVQESLRKSQGLIPYRWNDWTWHSPEQNQFNGTGTGIVAAAALVSDSSPTLFVFMCVVLCIVLVNMIFVWVC